MEQRRLLDNAAWRLVAGFAVLAGLLLSTFWIAATQRQEERWVTHTLDVQNRLALILSHIEAAETGQRGYIISGRPEFLEPYNQSQAAIGGELDDLERATSDNPAQRAALGRLRFLIKARLDRLHAGIALRQTQGFDATARVISAGVGRQTMDEIRQRIGAMRAEESRLLAIRQARSGVNFERLRVALVVGFALVIGLTITAARDAARRLATVMSSRDSLAAANASLLAEAQRREAAEAQLRQLQKMEAIGRLTGGIAHDFNNMLAVVIGSLGLAQRRLTSDISKAQASIEHALEGAQRAAALTARLLAFSRQQTLSPTAIDPNKLVGGLSEMVRRTIGETIQVETVLAVGVWRIRVDVSQIENAILNLCINAKDAMPGGGRLTLETSNAYLDDHYAAEHVDVRPGQYVLISVTDTGTGMPAEVVERAFDPFFTTKPAGQGTGLGLSQVFGVVKQSEGHVKIYSEAGTGTCVKIYLPRWTGADTILASQPPGPELTAIDPDEVILIVEDDDQVLQVSSEALRQFGYTILQASSGEQALQVIARQERIDLLFTDVVMPGMSGRELAHTVVLQRPKIKVLFTSGYTRNAIVHNGVLDAGVDLLPKPFTIEQLALKIRRVLHGQEVDLP